MTIFNSQIEYFKNPIGPTEGKLNLKVSIKKAFAPTDVKVIFEKQGTEENNLEFLMELVETNIDSCIFGCEINFDNIATYEYYYTFKSYDSLKYIRRNFGSFEGNVYDEKKELPWRLTVYDKITTHRLMQKGIMYQIFPDRFSKGNIDKNLLPKDRVYRNWGELPFYDEKTVGTDFFGGNFQGIIDKIKYLKSLNVNVLYSNPICMSSSNHRYDAIDYKKVDPVLGSEDDFKRLLHELHKSGIIFIQDAVMNHVGSDSIYFDKYNKYNTNGAYINENSPYRDWFYFDEENNYKSWWGFDTLPKLNYDSPELVNYIFGENGVFDTWYNNGIDGVRLDVADELPNEILKNIFEISKKRKGDKKIIIPEVWEDASLKWNYGHLMEYMLGHQATSVMNYPIRDNLLAYIRYGGDDWAHRFVTICNEIFKENYPKEIAHSLMNFLSTHDTVRAITKLAGPEVNDNGREWQIENNILSKEDYKLGRSRLMLAYLVIFFLPGIPSIYYGDEIGLQGMKDPFCRGCFTWDKIDKKILHFFKRLTSTRKANEDFLADADFNILICEDRFLLFERVLNNRKIKVAINSSKHNMDLTPLFITKRVVNGNVKEFIKLPNLIFQVDNKFTNNIIKEYDGITKIVLSAHNAIVFEEKI